MRPALTSRIDTLPERLDTNALDRVEKDLVRPCAQLEISLDNVLDHVRHLGIGHGRADQRAKYGILVRLAADGHLIELLAVLLDAEEADVADVMVAAGIDAARDVDVQPPEALRKIEIAKPARQFLRHRNRACIGKAAIVETRARDDVGDEPDIWRCKPERIERAP